MTISHAVSLAMKAIGAHVYADGSDSDKWMYRGHIISLIHDEDPCDPLDGDCFPVHLACFHRRYDLGNCQKEEYRGDVQAFKRFLKHQEATGNLLLCDEIYMYDHSGLALALHPFSCPWDSGQLGVMYVLRDEIRKEYGVKRISPKLKKQVINSARSIFETYAAYVAGDCYALEVEYKGEHVEYAMTMYVPDDAASFVNDIKAAIDYNCDGIKASFDQKKIETQLPLGLA